MPHRSTLRRWLVGWLYAAAGAHLLVGLAMTWLGDGGLFSAYHRDIAAAFWRDTPDERVQRWQAELDAMKADGSFLRIHRRWLGDSTPAPLREP